MRLHVDSKILRTECSQQQYQHTLLCRSDFQPQEAHLHYHSGCNRDLLSSTWTTQGQLLARAALHPISPAARCAGVILLWSVFL